MPLNGREAADSSQPQPADGPTADGSSNGTRETAPQPPTADDSDPMPSQGSQRAASASNDTSNNNNGSNEESPQSQNSNRKKRRLPQPVQGYSDSEEGSPSKRYRSGEESPDSAARTVSVIPPSSSIRQEEEGGGNGGGFLEQLKRNADSKNELSNGNHHHHPSRSQSVEQDSQKKIAASSQPSAARSQQAENASPEHDVIPVPRHRPQNNLDSSNNNQDEKKADKPLTVDVSAPPGSQNNNSGSTNTSGGDQYQTPQQKQGSEHQPLVSSQEDDEEESPTAFAQDSVVVLDGGDNQSPPGRLRMPAEEEDEDHQPLRFSLWRSPSFWFCVALMWQAVFFGYWIHPILHSVVVGSKTLTVFYRGILGEPEAPPTLPVIEPVVMVDDDDDDFDEPEPQAPVEEETETSMILVSEELPPPAPSLPSVNHTLVEEKMRLREENQRVAALNSHNEDENARRRHLNQQHTEQIRRMSSSNELTNAMNKKITLEAVSLKGSLASAARKNVMLEETLGNLSQSVLDCTEQYQSLKQSLDLLEPRMDGMFRQAEEKLSLADKALSSKLARMTKLSTLFNDISSKEAIDKRLLGQAQTILGEDSKDLVLDIFSVELWKPTPALNCADPSYDVPPPPRVPQVAVARNSSTTTKAYLTVETVTELVEAFKAEINQDVDTMQEDEDLFESIEWLVYESSDNFPVDEMLQDAPKPPVRKAAGNGPSLEEIQALVLQRLEVEQADQTGRIDYAALQNGGKILWQATSSSFVDTLPILNRVAAMLSLQTYGYGPEAALTPSWPANALGQCWAFQREKERDGVVQLTVQLARKIFVESVSIEHPPRERTNGDASTAIKRFQLLGYETADTSGEPWRLGSYVYNIKDRRKPARQEFELPRSVDGQVVPRLSVITLFISTTWGDHVSCLYRFRVHGTTEEEERDEQ